MLSITENARTKLDEIAEQAEEAELAVKVAIIGRGPKGFQYDLQLVPSTEHNEGDVVTIKEKSREMSLVLAAVDSPEREVPEYMDVNHDRMEGTFVRTPKLADVPYPAQMEPNLVVEYYSR